MPLASKRREHTSVQIVDFPGLALYPARSFSRGSVFTAEIVDEQGTAIEATFWRDAADRSYDLLEEGKVSCLRHGG